MEHRYVVDQKLAIHQGAQLAKLVCWYKPSEVLKLATQTMPNFSLCQDCAAPIKASSL